MSYFLMYEIILTNRAIKDLDSLDPDTRRRIGKKLEEYADNPFIYARKLKQRDIGSYRFRVGDYRIIFDLDENTMVILRIGHRKNIYE